MATFPVPTGQFAGMLQADLTALREKVRTALFDASMGSKPVSVTYAQGNGSKAVSFTVANPAELRMLLRQINTTLGVGGRAPLKPFFR